MSTFDITRAPSPLEVPADPVLRREWIKFQLRVRGSSLSKIARQLGVTRGAPKAALDRPYPRMERAIADLIGLQPRQIWPERYTLDGQPNRPMGRPKKQSEKYVIKRTTSTAARNDKSRRANRHAGVDRRAEDEHRSRQDREGV